MNNIVSEVWNKGLISKIESKSLPRGSASNVLNWLFKGDKIELRRGMKLVGANIAGTGKVTGLHTTRNATGTEYTYRTRGKKLEYYNVTTELWTEVGSDLLGALANGEEVSFADYVSSAGFQLWFSSPNSSLYKIMNANPASYTDMYDVAKNFKGYIDILLNRMFLWQTAKDKTGVYGSYIDTLTSTTVTAEAIGSSGSLTYNGTLAFKGAGAKRTCFALTFTDGTETFTDNYDGTLTGSLGGSGTINYTSGAYSITFNSAAAGSVTSTYQWEDSTNKGIADFTKSGTRVAGEGFIFRQDNGGTIQKVLTYADIQYCIHQYNTWRLNIGVDDTDATNRIYREHTGMPNRKAAVATGSGIFFVDDSDKNNPNFSILQFEQGGTEVVPIVLSSDLDLSGYLFDQAVCADWNDYFLVACRDKDTAVNNRLFVYDKVYKTWTILDYFISCFTVNNGELWAGDSITDNVFVLFSGTDDDDSTINNYFETNSDILDIDKLKKIKRLVIQGEIQIDQKIEVYISYDDAGYVLESTIDGSETYVDKTTPISVGNQTIGSKVVGSGDFITAYNYEREIVLRSDQFRRIKIKTIATQIGYASISMVKYKDIRTKSNRITKRFRQ